MDSSELRRACLLAGIETRNETGEDFIAKVDGVWLSWRNAGVIAFVASVLVGMVRDKGLRTICRFERDLILVDGATAAVPTEPERIRAAVAALSQEAG